MMQLAVWAQHRDLSKAMAWAAGWCELGAQDPHVAGHDGVLIFPFTRLVHVWSGFGTLAYVLRPYQVVGAPA